MMNTLIIAAAAGLLVGLLYCEHKAIQKAKLSVKTTLSALFIFAAVAQSHPVPSYYRFLLIGMLFCLGGDVLLALPQAKMFLWGLVSFLVGHLFYVTAFFHTTGINRWTAAAVAVTLLAGAGVFLWLRTHLNSMKVPVLCYILVISAMVVGAGSVMGADNLKLSGRLLAFGGALSFYLSDLFVARQRFLKAGFINRLIGLPLYYGGQFMLAFSVGWLKPIGS